VSSGRLRCGEEKAADPVLFGEESSKALKIFMHTTPMDMMGYVDEGQGWNWNPRISETFGGNGANIANQISGPLCKGDVLV